VVVRLVVRERAQQFHKVFVIEHLLFKQSLCQLQTEEGIRGVVRGVASPSLTGDSFL
jgi:hypothetical protein